MDFKNEKELQDFLKEKLDWTPFVTREKRIYNGEQIEGELTINYGPSIERLIDIKINALEAGNMEKARISQEIYVKYCYGISAGSIAYTAKQEEKVINLSKIRFKQLEEMLQNKNISTDNMTIIKKCKDFIAMSEGTKIEKEIDLNKLKEKIKPFEQLNESREQVSKENRKENLEKVRKKTIVDNGDLELFGDFYKEDVDYEKSNELLLHKNTKKNKVEENDNKTPKFIRYKIVDELITIEKYGEYAPVVQELLNRAMNEYDLSPEFVNIFVNSCDTIKMNKLPKKYKQYDGLTTYGKKTIQINKNILKKLKDKSSDYTYEYIYDVLNHEMMHMLLQQMPGIGIALTEAITEVAANRTSYGKNKNSMEKYRAETVGYPNMTFGVNILAAAMGKSEKEFLKSAFAHKTFEEIAKQIHSKNEAQEFLKEINDELEKIRIASFEEKHSIEEKKNIQTEAYHALYVKGKEYLNKKIANMDINENNIDQVIEDLKYSSNKMTQILQTELEVRGNKNLNPALNLRKGFGVYSSKEVQKIQADQRNTLNARIAILERLSKEFKENSAFKGENKEIDKKKILLYVQKYALSQKDIVSMNEILKNRWKLDLSDTIEEYLNVTNEKKFELKPETIAKIEKEDFSTSYDKKNIELMKMAVKPKLKTRLKNSILKLKSKIFNRKPQFSLPAGLDIEGKVRPERPITTKEEYEEVTNGVDDVVKSSDPYLKVKTEKQPSWVISPETKEVINKANKRFAEKYAKNKIKNKNPKDIEHDD